MPVTHKKGSELFEERMLAKLSEEDEGLGFDPTLIITLLTTLLPLIQNCFKPKPASLRRRGFNKIRLVHALREKKPDLTRAEAAAAVDAAYEVADEAKDEELQGFIDEVCVCN